MAKFKKLMKKFWITVWEYIKGSFLSVFMYMCASSILLMLTVQSGEELSLTWDSGKITWTVVCIVAAAAYNFFVMWAHGGNQYEMLVSGNVKRDSGYYMSTHKEEKEYRPWKGFIIGAVISLWCIAVAIIFGCNQAKIDGKELSGALSIVTIISFFVSGWSILPLYYMNASGIAVSYFLSCLFALIPIVVSGGAYIGGAYGRRNKAIREQQIADAAAKAAEEKAKNKKINYGGLPGTKPRKRK